MTSILRFSNAIWKHGGEKQTRPYFGDKISRYIMHALFSWISFKSLPPPLVSRLPLFETAFSNRTGVVDTHAFGMPPLPPSPPPAPFGRRDLHTTSSGPLLSTPVRGHNKSRASFALGQLACYKHARYNCRVVIVTRSTARVHTYTIRNTVFDRCVL